MDSFLHATAWNVPRGRGEFISSRDAFGQDNLHNPELDSQTFQASYDMLLFRGKFNG